MCKSAEKSIRAMKPSPLVFSAIDAPARTALTAPAVSNGTNALFISLCSFIWSPLPSLFSCCRQRCNSVLLRLPLLHPAASQDISLTSPLSFVSTQLPPSTPKPLIHLSFISRYSSVLSHISPRRLFPGLTLNPDFCFLYFLSLTSEADAGLRTGLQGTGRRPRRDRPSELDHRRNSKCVPIISSH